MTVIVLNGKGAGVKSYRILHVDDDPLMQDIVELALGLDPQFVVMSYVGAAEALAAVTDWAPDLIICDVMMPDMDGPAMLVRLRGNPATAKIPVIFITAHAKPAERERLMALGAVAVIAKPFYPVKLADTVRRHLQSIRLASAGYNFTERLRSDAAMLALFREKLHDGSNSPEVPEDLQTFAHKLAGAAGVFNFQNVSTSASALEDALIERRTGRCAPEKVEANLDALLECIGRERLGEQGPNRRQEHAGHLRSAG